ncbi:MAG: hypothetical protein R2818_15485 [Flavobacteriales bacterium]
MPRTAPLRAFVEEVGDLARFTGRFFREAFRPRFEGGAAAAGLHQRLSLLALWR